MYAPPAAGEPKGRTAVERESARALEERRGRARSTTGGEVGAPEANRALRKGERVISRRTLFASTLGITGGLLLPTAGA
ncbi:hypothetical protein ACFRNT_44615, partial [Streptomyces sp. NPDC056697]